jgi:hypothetical protein
MKMNAETKAMFAKEIDRAKARGLNYWAKAVGSASMRFGATLADAEAKATRDAQAKARAAGCPTMPPAVQSGEIE